MLPAYQSAISRALDAGDPAAAREYVGAYLRSYVWPADRTVTVFGSASARLLGEPVDGDGLDPFDWECVCCGYRDALPPERMALEAKASWLVCRACDQQRLHHAPEVVTSWLANKHLRLFGEPRPGRDTVHEVEYDWCGRRRHTSVSQLRAAPLRACRATVGAWTPPRPTASTLLRSRS